jgi:hypothetical protein
LPTTRCGLAIVTRGKNKYMSKSFWLLFGGFWATVLAIIRNGRVAMKVVMCLNEIIGATRAIEGSAYWIALVVIWMQTLGSQPVMPKISPITRTRGLPKP